MRGRGGRLPPIDGFLFLDRETWGLEALNGAVTEPAWRSKPTRYLVGPATTT